MVGVGEDIWEISPPYEGGGGREIMDKNYQHMMVGCGAI